MALTFQNLWQTMGLAQMRDKKAVSDLNSFFDSLDQRKTARVLEAEKHEHPNRRLTDKDDRNDMKSFYETLTPKSEGIRKGVREQEIKVCVSVCVCVCSYIPPWILMHVSVSVSVSVSGRSVHCLCAYCRRRRVRKSFRRRVRSQRKRNPAKWRRSTRPTRRMPFQITGVILRKASGRWLYRTLVTEWKLFPQRVWRLRRRARALRAILGILRARLPVSWRVRRR
jgi:hypothetical protein